MSNLISDNCPNVTQCWKTLKAAYKTPVKFGHRHIQKLSHNLVQKPIVMVAMVIVAIVTPLLMLIDFIYTKLNRKNRLLKLEGDCHNFFNSPLLDKFSLEMMRIFNSNLEKHPQLKLTLNSSRLETPFKLFENSLSNPPSLDMGVSARRAWFKELMNHFRALENSITADTCTNSELRQFMNDFTREKYTSVKLLPALVTHLNSYTEAQSLQKIYTDLLNHVDLKKDGDVRELFDAQYLGNIPFSLETVRLEQGVNVQVMRIPAVTKDLSRSKLTKVNKVAISEEFEYFLDALQADNKKHLYVNLMLRHDGNQAIRTRAIEELETRKDALIVMTLDKDSDHYHQKGKFSVENISATDFEATFLTRLLDKEGHYYLPKTLTSEIVQGILTSVRSDFYHTKDVLSRNERLDFIEHVYCRIIERVAVENKVTSMNLSCLNCIDRGTSQSYNFLSYVKRKGGSDLSEKELQAVLFGPAILVANRAIQKKFIEKVIRYNQGQ